MEERLDKLVEFLEENDDALFDQMLENLTDEELTAFFKDNPDFLTIKQE